MSQRSPINHSPARVNRRHDRHGGYDLTDIYEARLLAQGFTANEFVTRRSAADVAILPLINPTKIGRGSAEWELRKTTALDQQSAAPTAIESPPNSEPTPDENSK